MSTAAVNEFVEKFLDGSKSGFDFDWLLLSLQRTHINKLELCEKLNWKQLTTRAMYRALKIYCTDHFIVSSSL